MGKHNIRSMAQRIILSKITNNFNEVCKISSDMSSKILPGVYYNIDVLDHMYTIVYDDPKVRYKHEVDLTDNVKSYVDIFNKILNVGKRNLVGDMLVKATKSLENERMRIHDNSAKSISKKLNIPYETSREIFEEFVSIIYESKPLSGIDADKHSKLIKQSLSRLGVKDGEILHNPVESLRYLGKNLKGVYHIAHSYAFARLTGFNAADTDNIDVDEMSKMLLDNGIINSAQIDMSFHGGHVPEEDQVLVKHITIKFLFPEDKDKVDRLLHKHGYVGYTLKQLHGPSYINKSEDPPEDLIREAFKVDRNFYQNLHALKSKGKEVPEDILEESLKKEDKMREYLSVFGKDSRARDILVRNIKQGFPDSYKILAISSLILYYYKMDKEIIELWINLGPYNASKVFTNISYFNLESRYVEESKRIKELDKYLNLILGADGAGDFIEKFMDKYNSFSDKELRKIADIFIGWKGKDEESKD